MNATEPRTDDTRRAQRPTDACPTLPQSPERADLARRMLPAYRRLLGADGQIATQDEGHPAHTP